MNNPCWFYVFTRNTELYIIWMVRWEGGEVHQATCHLQVVYPMFTWRLPVSSASGRTPFVSQQDLNSSEVLQLQSEMDETLFIIPCIEKMPKSSFLLWSQLLALSGSPRSTATPCTSVRVILQVYLSTDISSPDFSFPWVKLHYVAKWIKLLV